MQGAREGSYKNNMGQQVNVSTRCGHQKLFRGMWFSVDYNMKQVYQIQKEKQINKSLFPVDRQPLRRIKHASRSIIAPMGHSDHLQIDNVFSGTEDNF